MNTSHESFPAKMTSNNTPRSERDEDAYIDAERKEETLGHRPAEGDGSAPIVPQKYQHGFFDPQVAHLRAIYYKIVIAMMVLVMITMWICFSVYWGSLSQTSQHIPNLKGVLVNRDGQGAFGQAVVAAFEANSRGEGVGPNAHLTWVVVNESEYPTNDDLAFSVVDEKYWAAVVVDSAATQNLVTARSIGDSSYNASTAVTFYYNQGRNEIAANSYIVPYTSALLTSTFTRFSAQFTAEYASSPSTSANALALMAQAPRTVTQPFSFSSVNLRPFTKTVSSAILLVGQIYITICAFIITMANDAARGIISPYLRLTSYTRLRIFLPMTAYIPLSLNYAFIQLAFTITFGAKFPYTGGFFVFWMYIYLGMSALGLATEAMITLLTPRFISFFLIFLIIFNVSSASVPISVQFPFYRWGYGFPVYNLSQAIRTIIFNTKSRLGVNAGVLIIWIALSWCTIALFTWYVRMRDIKEHAQKSKESEKDQQA